MPPRKDHKYEVNDKVLCKHGLYFYEAKIIEVEEVDGEMVYMVHYQGWHKRYDERIRQSQCADYFLPLTEANIAKAKADIQEATSAKSKRKRTKLEDDDTRKSETGSRASTPSDRAGSSSHAPSTHSERRGHSAKTENDTRKAGGDTGANRVSADLFAPEVDSQLEQLANLPRLIKNILVNEHDAVVNQGKLAILPARITVHDIVEKYVEFTESRYGSKAVEIEHESGITYLADDDLLIRTARAMRDYFDILLPYQLLYKFERLQFNTLAKKEQEKFDGVQARSEDAMPRRSRKSSREVKTSFPLSVYAQILDGGPLRPDIIRPSRFYGLAHLLRMLVKLPALLRVIPCDQADLIERIACLHDFIAFLRQNAPFVLDLNRDYKEATAEYSRSVGMS